MMLLFEGGNVINREIKRFEAHSNAYHFPVRTEHFDGLFPVRYWHRAFNHQSQIVFATNLLAARRHIFGRTDFTTAVAPSSFATGKRTATSSCRPTTTIFTAPIIRAICTRTAEWASADDDHILTGEEFRLLRDGFVGITNRVKYGCVS